MYDLTDRVDTGVGATRTENLNLRLEQLPRGVLHLALDGFCIVLYLPAAIARAFVFQLEFPRRHLFSDLNFFPKLIDRDERHLGLGNFHL
jgi:hypothetical protein